MEYAFLIFRMKRLLLTLTLLPGVLLAQKEERVRVPIRKVTVFYSGAQVEHYEQVSLKTGKQTLIFEQLTDLLDPGSIQLKSTANATILSVRTRKNFDEKSIARQEIEVLNTRRKKLDNEERAYRDEYNVLLFDEQLLQQNSLLRSEQDAMKMSELKDATAYYHHRMTEIRNRKSQLEELIETTIRSANRIEQEINTRRSIPVKNYKEIEVELDVTAAGKTDFTFSYITRAASWKPYYDMRSSGIGAPVKLEAKALITQNTGEDWNNVSLVLSTNDPYDNTQEPIIQPWYLNYNIPAPRKPVSSRQSEARSYAGEKIYGEVMDASTGEPLAFARLQLGNNPNMIYSTDIDGRFSFVVPNGESGFSATYLGYNSQYVPIRSSYTKVLLEPQELKVEEVMAISSKSISDNTVLLRSEVSDRKKGRRQREDSEGSKLSGGIDADEYGNTSPLATSAEKDLRQEFVITTPFSVPSDNADHRVAIAVYDMPASYEYHTVPKLDPSVFLVAQISGWEKLHLMDGESNMYFDGTYIGKSFIHTNSTKDTLSFSLGKDRKVIVERKRSEEKSKTRASGNRTRYEVQWDFSVRNNGNATIPFIMKDHFPLPVNADIKVKNGEYPGAFLDEKTGILTWKKVLTRGETVTWFFGYTVDYSNSYPIHLE